MYNVEKQTRAEDGEFAKLDLAIARSGFLTVMTVGLALALAGVAVLIPGEGMTKRNWLAAGLMLVGMLVTVIKMVISMDASVNERHQRSTLWALCNQGRLRDFRKLDEYAQSGFEQKCLHHRAENWPQIVWLCVCAAVFVAALLYRLGGVPDPRHLPLQYQPQPVQIFTGVPM